MLAAVDSGRLVAALEPCGHIPACVAVRFVADLRPALYSPQFSRPSTPLSLPSLVSPAASVRSLDAPGVRPVTPFSTITFLPSTDYIPELSTSVFEACVIVSHDQNPRRFAVRVINGRVFEHPSDVEITAYCTAFTGVPVSHLAGYRCIIEFKLDPENPSLMATPPKANIYFREEEVSIHVRNLCRVSSPSTFGPFRYSPPATPSPPDSAIQTPVSPKNSGTVAGSREASGEPSAIQNAQELPGNVVENEGISHGNGSRDYAVRPVEGYYTGIIAPSFPAEFVDHVEVSVSY
jgi:hypothetical protein